MSISYVESKLNINLKYLETYLEETSKLGIGFCHTIQTQISICIVHTSHPSASVCLNILPPNIVSNIDILSFKQILGKFYDLINYTKSSSMGSDYKYYKF